VACILGFGLHCSQALYLTHILLGCDLQGTEDGQLLKLDPSTTQLEVLLGGGSSDSSDQSGSGAAGSVDSLALNANGTSLFFSVRKWMQPLSLGR
jgi:hypothetical protein